MSCRPPPGLKGREIGLWYAKQNKEKRLKNLKHGGKVQMNTKQFNAAQDAIKASKKGSIAEHVSESSNTRTYNSKKNEVGLSNSYWYFPHDNSRLDIDTCSTSRFTASPEQFEFAKKLPVFKYSNQLLNLIKNNQVVVITGETGCGKTTQIPQYILNDALKRNEQSCCRIVCTQPRRISAISVAERVAYERGERCGEGNSCGYQIKLQSNFPRRFGSILYCTTGIIIQYLQSDPLLSTISHIVLDEIHERDMQSDFLIAIIKDVIDKRSDLKVILMSATLNAETFSSYFNDCPMFHVPGFTYPVTEYYLEEILPMINYKPTDDMWKAYKKFLSEPTNRRHQKKSIPEKKKKYLDDLERFRNSLQSNHCADLCEAVCCMDVYLQTNIDHNLIVNTIKHIVCKLHYHDDVHGAILVFLPGWEDIKKVNTVLKEDRFFQPNRYLIIPLHSMMPTAHQKTVFDRPPKGVTKIVLATNIAETSITIDDVVFVIDCGKIKLKGFDHDRNLSTLEATWETMANAKQRSGRAGRVQKGYCFRLFTKLQETSMEDFIVPEIVRTPLDQVCLQIKLLKLGKIKDFLCRVLNSPAEDSVDLSLAKLTALNALDKDENLTSLGYHLAQLPVEPQIGKMLLFGAIFSCVDPILTIASCLSYKDPFVVPLGKEKEADYQRKEFARGINSDHMMYAFVFDEWETACQHMSGQDFCWRNYLSSNNLNMIKKMRIQFAQYLKDSGFLISTKLNDARANYNSQDVNVVSAVLCSGLYPNVIRILKHRNPERTPSFYLSRECRVSLHPKSVNSSNVSRDFKHEWLCFYEKMKTRQINIYDTSEVGPYAILFFGGDLSTTRTEDNSDQIAVDGWIKFDARLDIAQTVKKLRSELDKLLEIKIKRPNWIWDDAQRSVIQSIIDLISRG